MAETGHARGAVLSLERLWALARVWYEGRDRPEWRGRSPGEVRRVLASVGLTGPFWEVG